MLNFNIITIIIGINAGVYLLIHIPLDIITQVKAVKRTKDNATKYPSFEQGKWFSKFAMLFASIFFWIFFIIWPILHLLNWDGFILYFTFEIPYISTTLQIIGAVIVSIGTFIACFGRISRSIYAISWGVPNQLTTKLMFRVVRHPLYTSYCFYFIGVPLLMQNYLLLILIIGIYGYYRTAKYEEEILVKEFGVEYIEYQRKVGMLLPFIGRRKNNGFKSQDKTDN